MLHNGYFKAAAIFGAAVVLIMTAGNICAGIIEAEKIQTEIKRYVLQNLDNEYDELEVTVANTHDVEVKNCDDPDIRISHDPERTHSGNMSVIVTIMNDSGMAVKHITLFARMKCYATVAVMNRDIKRGESVSPDDIVMKRVDVTRMRDFYKAKSEIVGMQAKKTLRAGNVLTTYNVCPVHLVRRGDKVNIEYQKGNVVVKTDGTARENGGYGEYIKVYIEMTKSTVSCKVINSETVALDDV